MKHPMKAETVATRIKIPLTKWPMNCHLIATAMAQCRIVPGSRAVYGFYYGPVARTSMFDYRRKFHRHGWLVLRETGGIVDPTRWVFEDVPPYIYMGPPSLKEYDEGMNVMRAALLRPPPSPDDPGVMRSKEPIKLEVSGGAQEKITQLLTNGRRPDGKLTPHQLFWLANVPYDMLEPFNKEVYLALDKQVDGRAWVPCDNWTKAVEEQ